MHHSRLFNASLLTYCVLLLGACFPGAFNTSPAARPHDAGPDAQVGSKQQTQREQSDGDAAPDADQAGGRADGVAAGRDADSGLGNGGADAREASAGGRGDRATGGRGAALGSAAGSGDARASAAEGGDGGRGSDAMASAPCPSACSAAHAGGRCSAGHCVYACDPGYGDCDDDPANGCEVDLSNTLDHCGSCERVCHAPDGGYATCAQASCTEYALEYGSATAGTPHGTAHAQTAFQACPAGTALAGLDGFVADGAIADTLRVWCRPLSVEPSDGGPAIAIGPASAAFDAYLGGTPSNPMPMVRAPYQMLCGDGAIVRAVRVTLWEHWSDPNDPSLGTYPTVKDVAIRCAQPKLESGHLEFTISGDYLTTGATTTQDDQPSVFEDLCAGSSVVTGVEAAFFANIDELTTYCTQPSLKVEATSPAH